MTTTMRLKVQPLNIRSLDTLDSWVEGQILALGATRPIDEANVRLVRLQNTSPAYHVHVHLVTPGPDAFAEIRAARRRSAGFVPDIYARAGVPFNSITPWQRDGLNE